VTQRRVETRTRGFQQQVERALMLLRGLQLGPSTKEELMACVNRQSDPPAYPQGEDAADDRFHRDVRLLRRVGIGVEHSRADGRWRLVRGQNPLLLLQLNEDELKALRLVRLAFRDTPYARLVEGLIARLAELLPEEAHADLNQGPRLSVALRTLDDLEPHLDTLRTMERALEVHRQVEFEYRPLEPPEPVRHRLEIEELALREGHVYLSGYEPDLDQWLDLRLDRIVPGSVRLLPKKFVPGRRRRRWSLRYRLSPTVARYGATPRFANHQEMRRDDGWVVVSAETDSLFWAAKTLLKYGEHCVVEAPPELVREMRRVVGEMAEHYGVG
jgi:predicted DNA-binding transcriptional regulator YafY